MKPDNNRFALPALVVGVILWALRGPAYVPVLTLCAIAIHEVGHVAVARICRVPTGGISFSLFEARIRLTGSISYGKEMMICLGGPLFNLTSAWLSCRLGGRLLGTGALSYFATVSVALAILNLLPIGSLDGGRSVYCLLSGIGLHQTAPAVGRILSFFALFCLWSASVYTLMRSGGNLSLFLFSATIFWRIFSETKP